MMDKDKQCTVFRAQSELKDKVFGDDTNFTFDAAIIQKAEKALGELSENFAEWLRQEMERLERSRNEFIAYPQSKENIDQLFRVAHDLKGQAATYGYPMIGEFCVSLCQLLDNYPSGFEIPSILVNQHVDAIKAVYREQITTKDNEKALQLLGRLRLVTEDCLKSAIKKANMLNPPEG